MVKYGAFSLWVDNLRSFNKTTPVDEDNHPSPWARRDASLSGGYVYLREFSELTLQAYFQACFIYVVVYSMLPLSLYRIEGWFQCVFSLRCIGCKEFYSVVGLASQVAREDARSRMHVCRRHPSPATITERLAISCDDSS